MQLLAALVFVFIVASIGILFVIFRVLLPVTLSRSEEPMPHARCRNCRKPIRGCHHHQGVLSAWVHAGTGDAYCADGLAKAEHR